MKYILFAIILVLSSKLCLGRQKADSLDLKISQMIMIGIGERTTIRSTDSLRSELASGTIGGIVLFEKNLAAQHTADSLKALIKALQVSAPIPLFISIDEEGGKVHRLKEKYGFFSLPSAEYLGQLKNPDSTLYYSRKLAKLLAELGINLNYAPSVDMAVNPGNTVIVKAGRSYGNVAGTVASQAALFIQGQHQYGIKTVLKHFPGHGSSAGDSHLGMVDVSQSWEPGELLPYDTLIRRGLCDAVMVAHIINRHWDASLLPATLSQKAVTGMLRGDLHFNGVVFSDDMQMKAISDNYGLERSIGLAVNSGIDVLMFANTIPDAAHRVTATQIHALIKKMVRNKTIPRQRIDESYRRIMAMKKGLLPD